MIRLLLAEDNEDTAELTQKMLEVLGYQVTVVRNGFDAVCKAAEEVFDLIILDIHMPVMDGFNAVAELRKHPKTKFIPTLAVSGGTQGLNEERYLSNGFDHFTAKPFTVAELDAAIHKLLVKPSQTE